MFLPIADKDKLYEDMRNDYILMSQLDKWTGWLTLKMGGLMAVASTSFITLNNINYQKTDNFSEINGGECDKPGTGDKLQTSKETL